MLSLTLLISRVITTISRKMLPRDIQPIVICGPSGSGKSTLLKRLFKEFPNAFAFSVSHTTRKPRPGEVDGVHYHFVKKEEMLKQIDNGEFIETAIFSGNIYGTSKLAIEKLQSDGKVCVLDIEIEGVKQVKTSSLNPIYIFIQPPSIEELEKRLRKRNTETEESLQKRLDTAKVELEYGMQPGNFDLIVHNHSLKSAYEELRDYVLYQLEKQVGAGFNICLDRVELNDEDFVHD